MDEEVEAGEVHIYFPLCLAFSCLPSPPSSFLFGLEIKQNLTEETEAPPTLPTTDSQARQDLDIALALCIQDSTPD